VPVQLGRQCLDARHVLVRDAVGGDESLPFGLERFQRLGRLGVGRLLFARVQEHDALQRGELRDVFEQAVQVGGVGEDEPRTAVGEDVAQLGTL